MASTLSNFQIIRPPYELDQETVLEWVAAAHAASAKESSIERSILSQLKKVGLGKGKIQQRGVSLADCLHRNWNEMEIYGALEEGAGLGARLEVFDRVATDIFNRFYPEDSPLPSHLIHVTCTGYIAPSPAQKLVAHRLAGQTTCVTHAYHMGCYASIPALRMAQGFASNVDIVHTEICSLHMNPSYHTLDQLVVQSLFGDGFIKYSMLNHPSKGFQILALQEEVLPASTEVMKWVCQDWGMKMTLSKDIPSLIVQALPAFVDALLKKAAITGSGPLYFAIHPGGPKIIEQVAGVLQLQAWQFTHSAEVLKRYGNMSSATLPHIWASMWDDPSVIHGAQIVSLAFGPGLTLAGAVLRCTR